MDVEQEGDSISTSASKDAGASLVSQDNTMEQNLDKEVLGLETTEGGVTTDDNEDTEISVASAGTASIKSSKKRKRNRRRKNKSRPMSENENLSRVASNERISAPSQEKPVVVTTYVCSSSELDKVRKLIDDDENVVSTPQNDNEASKPPVPEGEASECGNVTQDENDSVEVVYHLASAYPAEIQENDLSKVDDSGIEELSESPDHELQMEEETAQVLMSAGVYDPSDTLEARENSPLNYDKTEPVSSSIEDGQLHASSESKEKIWHADSTQEPVVKELDVEATYESETSSVSRKSKSDATKSSKGSSRKSKSGGSKKSKHLPSDKSGASEKSKTSKGSIAADIIKEGECSEKSASSKQSSKKSQAKSEGEAQQKITQKSTSRKSEGSSQKSKKSRGSEHSERPTKKDGASQESPDKSAEEENDDIETEDEVEDIEDLSIRSTKPVQENNELSETPTENPDESLDTQLGSHQAIEVPDQTETSAKSKYSLGLSHSEKSSEKSSKSNKSCTKEVTDDIPDIPETGRLQSLEQSEEAELTKNNVGSVEETCTSNDNPRSELVVLDALGVLNSNDFPNLELQDSNDCGNSSSAHENDDTCSIDDPSLSISKSSAKSTSSRKSAHSHGSETSKKSTSSRKSDLVNEATATVEHELNEALLVEGDESQASKASEKSCSSKSGASKNSKTSVRLEEAVVSREALQKDICPEATDDESQRSQIISNSSSKSGASKSSKRSARSVNSASSRKSSAGKDTVDENPLGGVTEVETSEQPRLGDIVSLSAKPMNQADTGLELENNDTLSEASERSASSKSASIKQSLSQFKEILSHSQSVIEDFRQTRDPEAEQYEASEHSQKSNSSAKSRTSRKSSKHSVSFSIEDEDDQASEAVSIKSAQSKLSAKSSASRKSQRMDAVETNTELSEDLEVQSFASESSKKSKSSKSLASKKLQLLEEVEAAVEETPVDQVDLSAASASSGSTRKSKSSRTSKASRKSGIASEKEDGRSEKSEKSETSLKSMTSQKSKGSVKSDNANHGQHLSEDSVKSDVSLKSQSSKKSTSSKSLRRQDAVGNSKDPDSVRTASSCKIILEEAEELIQKKDYSTICAAENTPDLAADTYERDPTEEDDDSQSTEISEKTAVIYDEVEAPVLDGLINIPQGFSPVNLETNMRNENEIPKESNPLPHLLKETLEDTEDEVDDIQEVSTINEKSSPKSHAFSENLTGRDQKHEEQTVEDVTSEKEESSLDLNVSTAPNESSPNKHQDVLGISSDEVKGGDEVSGASTDPQPKAVGSNFTKLSAFYCPATMEPYFDYELQTETDKLQDQLRQSSSREDESEASVYSLPSDYSNQSNVSNASKRSNHSGASKASRHSNRSSASKRSNHSSVSKASNHSKISEVSTDSKSSTSSRASKSCKTAGQEDPDSEGSVILAENEVICEEVGGATVGTEDTWPSDSPSIPLVEHPASSTTTSSFSDQLNKSSVDLIFKTKTISGNPSSFFNERSAEVDANVQTKSENLEPDTPREEASVRIEEVESGQMQHTMDESWLADVDNRDPSVSELGCSEIKLIKTDDIVLNDSMANNNYLQIHDPREEIEEIANKMQSCWYESQGVTELDLNPRAQPLAETELSLPLKSTAVSSTTLLLPSAPFPSVDNYQNSSLNPPSPQLHPSSLARIALIKREDPELAAFAQDAVRTAISQAQDRICSLDDDFQDFHPEAYLEGSESECSKLLSESEKHDEAQAQGYYKYGQEVNPTEVEVLQENYQDSEPDPCTQSTYGYENPEDPTAACFEDDSIRTDLPPMRLVLSSNKATTVNLSASSSNSSLASSTEALLRLPQVPNPSVANPEGLQNSSPPINLASLSRWVGDICSTKEMQDASCDGKQSLELEPKEILDRESASGAPSVSCSANCSEMYDFPDVPGDEIDEENAESIGADVSEQETDEERQKPDEEKILKELFLDDSSFIHDMVNTSIPEPPHWVIDPKVIEDAVTESDMTEDREPEKTSFIQSIFNCFGKNKHRSKKSKEDCHAYVSQSLQQKASGRGTSRFKSFSLPKRKK